MKDQIVTTLSQASEVKTLPKGTIVGDIFGGRTFNDNIAVALERRSCCGWRDWMESGQRWTLIELDW
ncbi:MAG: hypothetical protein K2X03_30950 [Bryobacteraceae bacterium]|nr:hypothetical protein [Bryobacteraceae bacterium]